MEAGQNISKKPHKLSGIAKFFLGFSLGIFICVFFIFVVKNSNFIQKFNEMDLFDQDQISETVESQPIPVKKSKKKNTNNSSLEKDSLAQNSLDSSYVEDPSMFEDSEFFIESTVSQDHIAEEKLLQSKTVKVTVKNSSLEDQINIPDNIIAYFEVQKWDSPIVNRLSYQRNHNILKIKGMDISKVSVYFINGKYYVTDGVRLFSIPNNSGFEKLSEINIAHL
jgi:hypothetical protein